MQNFAQALPINRSWFLAACLLFLTLPTVAAEPIIGRVSVIDGDTIEIHGQRIRLWGIDAPEGRQRCVKDGGLWRASTEAANAFDRFLASRPLTCERRDVDRYERIVALCEFQGEDIAAWLVREGWAFDYARYSDGYYAGEQREAIESKRGHLARGV